MRHNLNDVELPEGARYADQEVLKVLNRVVSDEDSENGYMLLLGNGDKQFVTDEEFDALGEAA